MNHLTRLTNPARAGLAFCVFASLCVVPARAVTLQTFVNGYYGGNYLSDGTTFLPDTTLVDFGFFYTGGTYTSASAIGASLLGLNGNSASLQSFRANNNWVSLGSGQVSGGNGEFTLGWDAGSSSTAPGLGSELNLNPSSGVLNGQNLAGKTPFVWIQTPNTPSGVEFWVGVSNLPLPSAGFGAFYAGDVTTDGFTMVYGTAISSEGVTTIPEPSVVALAMVGTAGLFAFRRRSTLNQTK